MNHLTGPTCHRHRRRGIALVWVAMMGLMLIGMVGLTLDTAKVWLAGHQLQIAADASALAGALEVRTDPALARTRTVAMAVRNFTFGQGVQLKRNDGNAVDGDIVVGRYDDSTRLLDPTDPFPNAVRVSARRLEDSLGGQLPLLFGPIFGVSQVNVSRSAIAKIGGSTGAGVIALCGDCECALEVTGNVNLNVCEASAVPPDCGEAAIQVNSTDPCGTCGNGTPYIDTSDLNLVSDSEPCFSGNPEVSGDINTGEPPIPDPLAFLPPPPIGASGTVTVGGGQLIHSPGDYPAGLIFSGGDVVLNTGIYTLGGVGLDIGGNTIFTAEGVMIYVYDTGVVDLTGTGAILITPLATGTYENISIFQARAPGGDFNETGTCGDSRIIGTGLLDLQGTLYFPCAFLEIGGEGDGFGNQLIAWKMWVHGNAQINIQYSGDLTAPGDKVFLVE